jgi:hypothetical protein
MQFCMHFRLASPPPPPTHTNWHVYVSYITRGQSLRHTGISCNLPDQLLVVVTSPQAAYDISSQFRPSAGQLQLMHAYDRLVSVFTFRRPVLSLASCVCLHSFWVKNGSLSLHCEVWLQPAVLLLEHSESENHQTFGSSDQHPFFLFWSDRVGNLFRLRLFLWFSQSLKVNTQI